MTATDELAPDDFDAADHETAGADMVDQRAWAIGRSEVADPRRMRGRVLVVLGICVAAMVIAMMALVDDVSGGDAIELPRVEVPSVRGLDLATVHTQLEALGFVVDVRYQPNEVVPKGQVFTQEPPPRARSEQGSVIRVIASDGPVGVTAPNVIGQQITDATANLTSVGLAVEITNVPDESVRAGEVIHSVPAPGQRVTDATMRLQVSSGPAPRIVPAVIGQPIEVALAALGHDGLNVGDITRVNRPDLAPGTVFAIDPAPGTGLPKDTPVALRVAGPAATATVPYLVALRQASAGQVLKVAGLTMSVVTTSVAFGDPNDGKVVAQGFPPQSRVPGGTAVEVTVAVADPPPTPPTVPGGPVDTTPTTAPGG